ncbi:MAG TPA: S46 family peptidase [Ignavibacteria bacterium]|nr:S46 family peptidase [Ignavibacteria bacterium]
MKKSLFTLILAFFFAVSGFAQEGMWLLNQIDKLDLNSKGLKISTGEVYSKDSPALYQAIVQLGGGTASFVSGEGLLVTNHHVAYTALQRASTKDHDYITDGYLARTKQDEIKAAGYQARLLIEMRDVTDEIYTSVKGVTDPVEMNQKINLKISEMRESNKMGKEDIEVRIADMFNGKQYILFKYKVIKDIRIVYSPPLSIGNYGGEIDNWMWPRHTGDFSFMRAYVSPDGTGREYSADNVPYKPAVWLKVAKDGLQEGDFTFIMGYPGQTTRYRTSNSIEWNQNKNYPFSIKNFKEIIALAGEKTKNDKEGEIRVANLVKGLANAMKNYEGKVAGMKKTNYLQKKIHFEQEFINWVNSDNARKQKYGDIFPTDDALYRKLALTKDRDNVFGVVQGFGGTQLGVASNIYFIKKELLKPQAERQPGIDENVIDNFIKGMDNNYLNYFEPFDKALLVRALGMASKLPDGQRIKGLEYILTDNSRSPEEFVNDAFRTSKLNDPEFAKKVCKMSLAEIEALNDPFMKMAASMYPESEEISKDGIEFGARVQEVRKKYIDGLFEWKGEGMYPDANGTMRFTWGNIKGYKPADAVTYYPFTTLKGVIEKNTGEEPFNAPDELVRLYEKKDFGKWMDPSLNDIPVAFTHQCDITGGNSGSPVMNAKGEIIGLAFDGNYEGMISDWQFDYDLQRTISVDIRYVLFITEKFGKADFILKEMGVANN